MLKFYYKALKSKTPEDIDRIAQEIHSYSIKTHRNHFERNCTHFSSTLAPSLFNQYTASYWSNGIDHQYGPVHYLNYVLWSFAYIAKYRESKDDRMFFMSSFTLFLFSKPSYLTKAILPLKIDKKHEILLRTIAASTAQVYGNHKVFKSINNGILDTASKIASVTLINLSYEALMKKITKMPLYYRLPLNFGLTLLFGHVNEMVSTIGIKQYIFDSFEGLANLCYKERKTGRLPDDNMTDVPESMQCAICHDLLVAPMAIESQGFVCKECLIEWLKYQNTNPLTGLQLNLKEVKRNIPMEILVSKFYTLALENQK